VIVMMLMIDSDDDVIFLVIEIVTLITIGQFGL